MEVGAHRLFPHVVLVLLLVEQIDCQRCDQNGCITFGALLNGEDADVERKVFKFAEGSVYRKVNLRVTKSITVDAEAVNNSFDTSIKDVLPSRALKSLSRYYTVCSLAGKGSGVLAIFGPTLPKSAGYVRSFSSTFRIPHIEIHPDFSVFTDEMTLNRQYTLNMWPDLHMLRQAYSDLAQKFDWKEIMVITSSKSPTGYLPIMTHILELVNSPGTDVMIRPVKNNEQAVQEIKTFPSYKNIIVDLPQAHCIDFITKAHNAKLFSGYYHYHFTTMDLYPLANEIRDFVEGAVNVTTFSMIDFDSEQYNDMRTSWNSKQGDFEHIMTKTKNALIYDSMFYVAKVLKLQISLNRDAYETEKMNCNGTGRVQPWTHGEALYKRLTLNTSTYHTGVTGNITLNADGIRHDFFMQLLEFDNAGRVSKVGTWNTKTKLIITKTFDKVKEDIKEEFQRIDFAIAVKEEIPAVSISDFDENGEPLTGNDRFQGFSIDMMKEIANILAIARYHFVEVTEGSVQQENGTFTGIVGGLMTREYDIGLSPITVTVERSRVVDFTTEYLNLGISILMKKPDEEEITLFKFMQPFHYTLWLAIFGAFLTTSFVLYIVGRFSPGQWANPHPCSPDVDLMENDLNPTNSLWFAMGSFLQQAAAFLGKSPINC